MWIYVIENTVNGKLYVGQTTQKNPQRRWTAHKGGKSGAGRGALKAAIQKYGSKQFVFTVIDSASSQEELDGSEVYWIHHLNSMAPGGYNLMEGGSGERIFGEAARSRMKASAIARAEREGRRRVPKTAEEKESCNAQNRATQSARLKSLPFFKGRTHTLEAKNKMAAAKFGKQNHTSPVVRSDGQQFKTVKEAAAAIGAHRTTILKQLAGTLKTCHGFTFSYLKKGEV